MQLPLLRKMASSVGIAEIVLLEQAKGGWLPRAIGELAPHAIARADAWLAVPGGSEGYAAGSVVDAYMLTGLTSELQNGPPFSTQTA